jgi:hypothetical protein
MGCLVALVALFSPRLAIFFLWLLTNRMSLAFTSGWIAVVGFLVLPWTTLAYAVAFDPAQGVKGFGWFLVGFAFLVDISSYLNGERRSRSVKLRRAR